MKPAARHRARECAVQAIYSWQLSGNSIADVEVEFLSEQDMSDVDVTYFRELLNGVSTHVLELDKKMAPYLSRQLGELGQVEKAVLRLAMFELCYRDDVPYKVAILVVLMLYLFGGSILKGFSLVMLIGVMIGTVSSIYVASALALKMGMKREHLLPPKVEKEGADQHSLLP